jgi:MFS transporter, OFA family, oxalate/formate antiporter
MANAAGSDGGAPATNRWWQLVFGILCMVMIANFQYGWTLFVNPMDQKFHWGRAAIQVAFTIFILTETWLVPAEAYLVDRFGPRRVVMAGGVLVGIAWTMNSYATSLSVLYIAAAFAGIGAGAVYGTCVGNALKWFPDRRGLAAGLTAAGFGMGASLTVLPIQTLIRTYGYEFTFRTFGIAQGILVILFALALSAPTAKIAAMARPLSDRVRQTTQDFLPGQTLRTPMFWLLYVMFILVATGGLMAVAQLALIAKDFGVATVPVSVLGLTLPALSFALSLNSLFNGLCRPFFGWVSDHLGRENTMALAFALEGCGIWLLAGLGSHPLLFILFSAVVFFGWGEIFSLFPAISADIFGRQYATTNYGLLYTAKGTAALFIPFANILAHAMGSWMAVFAFASVFDLTAAVLAFFVLKNMTRPSVSPTARMAAAD